MQQIDVYSMYIISQMSKYIHQKQRWPEFQWDTENFLELLGKVHLAQGRLLGKMQTLGFTLQEETVLRTITNDVIKSSEIEGEKLNLNQVRSSVAKRLGVDIAGSIIADRDVEGVVEMMLDATQNYKSPLTAERLHDWQASLFPTGRSGMYKVIVGNWRDDSTGPMQVVSGPMGKQKVHFEAPAAGLIEKEMKSFLNWFNNHEMDNLLKAAVAHLWFLTIHPFEDGNGRIARALTDLLLARSDQSPQRFYSMSSQIKKQRKQYYKILEQVQTNDLDITKWIVWFLECLQKAIDHASNQLESILIKVDFWSETSKMQLNERQHKMINKLLDGFKGKLTSSKWAKINKCSRDSAIRDINDLISKNILRKDSAGGRSTNYELVFNQQ